jgi:DNA ligase-1
LFKEVKGFPTLYGKASTGKIKIWKVWVEAGVTGVATIITEHGYEDGEIQQARVKIMDGKNIGRSNETTPFQQACLEAESKWNKKRDKKYVTDKKELGKEDDVLLPMLAHDFKKRGHKIDWPAFVQPKLNGIRCLARKVSVSPVIYTSRAGKDFPTLGHLTPYLINVMNVGDVFDGELFTRELTFQEITAAVKRQKTTNPNIEKVEFWVYDVVFEEMTFKSRNKYLKAALAKKSPIIYVPTRRVKNKHQMREFHAEMVRAEYEGTIIRNAEGLYRCDYRSADLQKYKDFIDEEFEIIGGKEGIGKDEGAVTFICLTEEGKPFDCRPRGTYEQRQEWWKKLGSLLGKKLTVRYQTRSDDNIPIFPVGIAIRDYE